jgi:hypothetical protein
VPLDHGHGSLAIAMGHGDFELGNQLMAKRFDFHLTLRD